VIIQRGYKVELDPTNEQVQGFAKACGIARFAYNWALHRKEAGFRERNLNRTVLSIKNELNRRKREEFPWMYEASKCVSEEALWDLDEAYKKFFRHLKGDPKLGISMARFCKECNAMRFGRHFGARSFRSRRRGLGSFRIDGSRVRVYADRIQIQTLGLVRLKERGYIPWEDVRILNATISEQAGRWFVSVNVEQDIEVPSNDGPEVGMDLGLSTLATLSDRTTFENPKALARHGRKLERLQRAVSRKKKGCNNRRKAVQRLSRAHLRIANSRKDFIHKMTTKISRGYSVIGMEDLNVKGLMRGNLARSLGDASLGEVRRQLEYKTRLYGSRISIADQFYPSSQLCSNCGCRKPMTPHVRVYECLACGFVDNRDHNAAVNLEPSRLVAVGSPDTLNARQRPEVQTERLVPVDEARINGR